MTKTIIRRLFAAIAAVVLTSGLAAAQTRPVVRDFGGEAPATFLFVGNSFFYYNNSMHGHVGRLVRGLGAREPRRYRAVSATISGSGLDWHDVESYFRPNAVGAYSFDTANNIVMNPPGRVFDAAIMMDCSQCPVHPTLAAVFTDYAKRHADTVRRHGARPILFMSWAYADKPEMTAQLAEAYTIAGNANDALVIPAGLAFAKSIAERPGLNLYIADLRHPSLPGTYLAAATVYAAIYGRSPEGSTYTAGLDPETAAFLQSVAWRTVREYFGAATN